MTKESKKKNTERDTHISRLENQISTKHEIAAKYLMLFSHFEALTLLFSCHCQTIVIIIIMRPDIYCFNLFEN